jgi:transposase
VTRRGELTDEAWERIAPLLPENGRRGKQWKEHREVVNGILWRIRTGAPWRDLCPLAMAPGKPATTASPAGAATAPGIGCWPTCR